MMVGFNLLMTGCRIFGILSSYVKDPILLTTGDGPALLKLLKASFLVG